MLTDVIASMEIENLDFIQLYIISQILIESINFSYISFKTSNSKHKGIIKML